MRQAKYTRLYADKSGESHFEDLEISLSPVNFAPPAPPLNIAQFLPAVQSLWMGVPPGWAAKSHIPALAPDLLLRCRANMR